MFSPPLLTKKPRLAGWSSVVGFRLSLSQHIATLTKEDDDNVENEISIHDYVIIADQLYLSIYDFTERINSI